MTDPNPDLDARLARLAARKAGAAPAPQTTPSPMPSAPARRRRRHPAAAGRILSVGLSSSAFLSMVAAFGAQSASGSSNVAASTLRTTASPAADRVKHTKIVVREVHHVLYVDQYGRPIPAALVPKGAQFTPAGTQPAAGAAPPGSPAATHAGSSSPSWMPSSGPSTSPTPTPAPGAPTNTPPPSSPGSPPASVVTPPPTAPPATTAPRASPPTTVVTTPPPPPPPACSGTKCP